MTVVLVGFGKCKSKGKSNGECRSFGCGACDEAASTFAQDDSFVGWIGEVQRQEQEQGQRQRQEQRQEQRQSNGKSNGKSNGECRSFGCGACDEAASTFAQDDSFVGWVRRGARAKARAKGY